VYKDKIIIKLKKIENLEFNFNIAWHSYTFIKSNNCNTFNNTYNNTYNNNSNLYKRKPKNSLLATPTAKTTTLTTTTKKIKNSLNAVVFDVVVVVINHRR